MKIEFRDDILTTVPTYALIEDIQTLMAAQQTADWEAVQTVIDCLAESIGRYTEVPDGLHIIPSPTSIIVPSVHSGIVLADGEDVHCACGTYTSHAMDGGCCQCPEWCPGLKHGCAPEGGKIILQGGYQYNVQAGPWQDEELISFLEASEPYGFA